MFRRIRGWYRDKEDRLSGYITLFALAWIAEVLREAERQSASPQIPGEEKS